MADESAANREDLPEAFRNASFRFEMKRWKRANGDGYADSHARRRKPGWSGEWG